MRKRDPEEFVIWDEEKQIVLKCCSPEMGAYYWDDDSESWVDESNGNRIEISFRQDEGDGWGFGGGEYVTTSDIKAMADSIRSVINKEQATAQYTCLDDLFRLGISYDAEKDTYTLTASMMELCCRDHHITITKTGLARETLDEYIEPFFIWEKHFPIIGGNGIIYKRTKDKEYAKFRPFCAEPILRTHRMKTGVGDGELWEQLDYSHEDEIVYHAIPGYWLVFETEHYYISVGADGIKKYKALEQLKENNRQIWDEPVADVEGVVFVGEEIRHVHDGDNEYDVQFDHFHMTVIPHETDDGFKGTAYQVEKLFYGFEHILNQCVCNGQPEFRMNRHHDFYIECPVCKRYTNASYDAAKPVTEWNSGQMHCIPGNENIKADLTRVFIKLDDVLADFRRGVEEFCHMEAHLPTNDLYYADDDSLWNKIKGIDHFFDMLELVPGAKEMFDLIYEHYGDRCVIIAGLPMPQRKIVNARLDKYNWVHRNLAEGIRVSFIGTNISYVYCKGEDDILIDNNKNSIKDWEKCGGKGILFKNARKTVEKLREMGLLPEKNGEE